MRFETKKAAIVVVDLQKGFLDDDGFVAVQGRDVSTCRAAGLRAVALAEQARAAGMPVFWLRYAVRPDYADAGVLIDEIRPNVKKMGGLRSDSPETALIDAIKVRPQDTVIDKTRYSGFVGTALEPALRARGISQLVVCGVTTSMCVESTVRDAGQLDYRVFVARECCGDFDKDRHEASLKAMAFGFARVVGDNELAAAFQRGSAEF
ncbi:MAG: cysteine hydrolase [Alphaproteobacteria bacterium]|nr:cysteine hydrolase [Alphaproteobacteria bacterium]